MFSLTDKQAHDFHRDGFVFVDKLISDSTIKELKDAFDKIFSGQFETGVRPDEVNWQEGESNPTKTRQICNAWKGNLKIAKTSLREDIGKACAKLGGWPGARIQVDNALWKPPGVGSIGMHRDCSYLSWLNPREMISCWIALDDTTADGGTMELVTGSHQWSPTDQLGEFHDPTDYQSLMRASALAEGVGKPEIVPVLVEKGSGSFHHGWTWHGSGPNTSGAHRRALVVHCISSEAHFVSENISVGTGPIYGRYRHQDSERMDESFFPILWSDNYGRTHWLDNVSDKW